MLGASITNLILDMTYIIEKTNSLDKKTINNIKSTMIQAKELKKSAVSTTLADLKPEVHNETRSYGTCNMLKKWTGIRSELIEVSSLYCI